MIFKRSISGAFFGLLMTAAVQAAEPALVLLENVDLSAEGNRVNYPVLISNGRGYRIRCQTQVDEENVIRGLGFLSPPSGLREPTDPEMLTAAPQDNPRLCPQADDYKIKVFAFSDETGLNHYLQFPDAFGSANYVGKLYRPRCAGLVTALKVDLESAINADPRPFFAGQLYDIDGINCAPPNVRPKDFAAWCMKTDLDEAQTRTLEAILESTPAGAAGRGNAAACANAQAFLQTVNSLNLAGLGLSNLDPLSVLGNLTTLVLEDNNLADLTPLSSLAALTFLDLSGNAIANLAPLSPLAALTEIDLGDNQISNLRPLSSNLALTVLDLSGNKIADVSPLRFLRKLTRLDLASNQISGAGIEPLTGLNVLLRLDLSNNRIESVEALSQFAQTTEILLDGNPVLGNTSLGFAETCVLHRNDATPFGFTIRAMVTQSGAQSCDAAAAALNSNPALDLSAKMISDVRPVALLKNLTSLNLASNAIVDVSALTSMRGLAALNLANNSIVKADGLAALVGLSNLDLSGNPVDVSRFTGACLVRNNQPPMLSQDQAAEIAVLMAFADKDKCLDATETLRRTTSVTLQNVGLKTVAYFPIFESANRLNLRQNALVDVEPLRALARVTSLNLSQNQLTSIADITAMASLETLNLSGNPISALNGIQALQQLKSLLISNTQVGSVRLLAGLPLLQSAQLQGLSINYTDMEDYCLVHRLDTFALTDARPFMLAIEPRLAQDGIDARNCPAVANWARSIEALNLNKTGLVSIDPIRFFTNLRSLTMFDNHIRDAAPVRNLTRLETLNMAQNLIEAIPPLQSNVIKNLTLNQNRIVFLQVLQPKTSLTVLRLDNNRIRDARPLNNLVNLTYLDLRSNQIESGDGVNGLFPRKPYLKGNPVCNGSVILIFPPPPIVEACTREPDFGFILVPFDNRVLLDTELMPHVLNPRPFQ